MRNPLALILCLAAMPAGAEIRSMAACETAIAADPSRAREEAALWVRSGGGVPARLCEALALRAAGAIRNAAVALTDPGQDTGAAMENDVRAAILTEAGQSWLSLDVPDFARPALVSADRLLPGRADTLLALARAEVALGLNADAAARLDRLLASDPGDADALLLRAAVRRTAGDFEGAARDLATLPDTAPARLERAWLALDQGDAASAADLLLATIRDFPGGQEAMDARDLLQQMAR